MPPSGSRLPTRRRALRLAGAAAAALAAPTLWLPRLPRAAENGRRVVIAGGGYGGLAVATALRRLAPEAEIVVVEPHDTFFAAASSLDVVMGRMSLADATRSYADLVASDIRVVRGGVRAVDAASGRVETDAGGFDCSAFVLATGMEPRASAIEGLDDGDNPNLGLYDRRALPALARRVAAFERGTAVVSVPPGALKCPPAPYEYALALARNFRTRGIDGKVVLIDAWPTPQPDAIGQALADALAAAGDRIEYIPQEEVEAVDLGAGEVVTGFGDRIAYDLLTLIPPNETSSLVADLDLAAPGDRFAAVDPVTFRSERHETVFAIGDVARTPYGNSAASAAASAPLCARAIARMLDGRDDEADLAELSAACYPMVAEGAGLRLEVDYVARRRGAEFDFATQVAADGEASVANAERREIWHRRVLGELFRP